MLPLLSLCLSQHRGLNKMWYSDGTCLITEYFIMFFRFLIQMRRLHEGWTSAFLLLQRKMNASASCCQKMLSFCTNGQIFPVPLQHSRVFKKAFTGIGSDNCSAKVHELQNKMRQFTVQWQVDQVSGSHKLSLSLAVGLLKWCKCWYSNTTSYSNLTHQTHHHAHTHTSWSKRWTQGWW